MHRSILLDGALLVSLLVGTAAGCAPTVNPGLPAEIKLGAVQDLTGPTANYGTSIQKGVDLAVKQINQGRFFGEGHRLSVAYQDAGGDPAKASAAFQSLSADNELVAILGPTLSGEALAADPIAQQAGIPVVASSNTAGGITDIGDFIFRTSLPESAVIPNTIAVAAKALGPKKVAVIYDSDDAFTRSAYEVFKSALAKNGIQIVAEETFANGDRQFKEQLTRIKSVGPDAIVISALADEAGQIMLQARALGIPEGVAFIGGNGFNSRKVVEVAGSAAEGAVFGSAWDAGSTFPASTAFVQAFESEYGAAPDQFAAQAYTAAWVLAIAIKNAGGVDRKAVRDALAATRDFDSPLGSFSFDAHRDPVHAPVVLVVRAGAFEVFAP